MNSFSSSEISDLFGNGFRLEQKHPPLYLAECFQRLCPSLQRMNPSYLAEAIIRSNGRIFEGGGVLRGETLNLNFFFELWKQNFRFESGIYDKFTFGDELRLAYKINSRDFWDVLIRADRDLGTYLKDSMELFRHRELPREISLNLRPNGSSVDDKTVRLLREKLPFNRDNFTTHEIAKTCLQLFEVSSPADYDVRRLAEELERENGIRRLNGEPFCVIPKKALDRLSTKCVLEFFKSKPLASAEASAMDRGVYAVTEADVILAQRQGSDVFWMSIIPDKSIRERTLNMWKLAGMDSDARRFTAGKQILIATDRALSDALYKHSAEMRDVYGMCRQAGVSTQEADKFMAMLYLCHGFYKLPDINIDYTFIGKMKHYDARKLWDTLQKEAFTPSGIARVNGAGKKLVEEEERQLKLAQQQLLVRGDYRGHGDPVEPAYPQTSILKVKEGVADFSALYDEFENALGSDFTLFKQKYPQYDKAIVLSETFRTPEMQARELLRAWKSGKIVSTYGINRIKEDLFLLIIEMKDPQEAEKNKTYTIETLQTKFKFNYRLAELVKKFIDNPTESKALDLFTKISADGMNGAPIYGVTSTSKHLSGLAVDVSGSQNAQLLKRDLILFLHKTQKYRILIYPRNGSGPELILLEGKVYEKQSIKPMDYLLSFISTHASTWFFHVEKA